MSGESLGDTRSARRGEWEKVLNDSALVPER